MLLSTLHAYINSLGGELELVCTFKDREPVRITTDALKSIRPDTQRVSRR